jgi:hypothetical protein
MPTKKQLTARVEKDIYFEIQQKMIQKQIKVNLSYLSNLLLDNLLCGNISITNEELKKHHNKPLKDKEKIAIYLPLAKDKKLNKFLEKNALIKNKNALFRVLYRKYIEDDLNLKK